MKLFPKEYRFELILSIAMLITLILALGFYIARKL